jgi:hypothetical protein
VCFAIVCPGRTLELQAASEFERDMWLDGLKMIRARLRGDPIEEPVVRTRSASGSNIVRVAAVSDDEAFIDVMRKGAALMKHGRRGDPHLKVIKVDPKTGDVTWGQDTDQGLSLREATQIVPGKNTSLFSKVKLKVAHPTVCFSIVCPNRTLDLQAASEDERDQWVSALRQLKNKFDAEVAPVSTGMHRRDDRFCHSYSLISSHRLLL